MLLRTKPHPIKPALIHLWLMALYKCIYLLTYLLYVGADFETFSAITHAIEFYF